MTCEKAAALKELGAPAGTRCEIANTTRVKCEANLCCGAAVNPKLAADATVTVKVIETCQPAASSYYFHTPSVGATQELWAFTCIEAAKYLSSALSLVGLLSFLVVIE